MTQEIEPITLPPHLLLFETMLASWNEAMLEATDQYLKWCVIPFGIPAHHDLESQGQLGVPDPFEEDGEHGLFA
jgi:hypothetical protein